MFMEAIKKFSPFLQLLLKSVDTKIWYLVTLKQRLVFKLSKSRGTILQAYAEQCLKMQCISSVPMYLENRICHGQGYVI